MKVTKVADILPGHCQCGKPLHYSSPKVKAMIDRMIDLAGDQFVSITVPGLGTYRVQRHFIALHGWFPGMGEEMGFERVI